MDISFIKKLLNGTKKLNKVQGLIIILIILVTGSTALGVNIAKKNAKKAYEASTRAYEVILNDDAIGVVRNTKEVDVIISDLEELLSDDNEMEVKVNEDIKYVNVHTEDENLTPLNEIRKRIKDNITYEVVAYGIYIDGKKMGVLRSRELGNQLLDKVKEPYINMMNSEGSKIEKVQIVEDVEIKEELLPLKEVQEFEEVLMYLQKGTTEEKIHTVENGENYWTIAKKYNLTVEELEQANPGKDHKLIHPGDKVSLIVPKPYLTVSTFEEKTYVENIEYTKEYEKTASLYVDETRIKRKGIPGKKEVVAKVEKQNGVEVAKEVIKEAIIANPVAQIVLKGTKALPPLKGTGSFINPTRGTITSRFGSRWGRNHEGLDIGARTGTAIKAADGGVVTYAGWNGSYGLMVEIDHGGGFKTRYAHASKIYVKVGEKVYKDKTIAAVGNTGRSTGPHLHFEVRKHNVPQNPLSYIGKKYR